MIKNYTLSLIIPCKNEAKALETVLLNLPRKLSTKPLLLTTTPPTRPKKWLKLLVPEYSRNQETTEAALAMAMLLEKALEKHMETLSSAWTATAHTQLAKFLRHVKQLLQRKLDFISCNRLPFKHPQKMSFIRALGVKILNFND